MYVSCLIHTIVSSGDIELEGLSTEYIAFISWR